MGIPLPEEFQAAFEDLVERVKLITPKVETVYPKTPHITGYYLDVQENEKIPEIMKIIAEAAPILRTVTVTVGGADTFGGQEARVLFLDVQYPPQLLSFNAQLVKGLGTYYTEERNLPFHPHLTVGRIRTLEARTEFLEKRPELTKALGEVRWNFEINEVALYGKKPNSEGQHHEILRRFPVK